MSLINDALKRANQAQPPPPPTIPSAAPLHPADHQPQPRWFLFLIPVALLALVLSGWFVVKGLQVSRQLGADAQRLPLAARELPRVEPTNQLALLTTTPATTSTNATSTNAEPKVEVVKPSEPEFKLQGIFYRPNRPSAMVNSKTVFVGDRVAGAKVLAISRESITLQHDGKTKVLTLD